MAKHSNRRARRGIKKRDEDKRAENRELEAYYDPEQREKRRLEIFVDTAGQTEEAEETSVEEKNAINFGLISEALQEYLNGVNEVIDGEQLQDEEERQVFLQNVYNEIADHELKLLGDPISSVTLEKLFIMSDATQILNLLHIVRERLLDVVSHRFASHGCQTLLKQAALMIDKELRQGRAAQDEEDTSEMATCLLDILKQLSPHLVPLTMDVFGSHVIRSLFYILAGKPIVDDTANNTAPNSNNHGGLRSKRSAQFSTHHIVDGKKNAPLDKLKVPVVFKEMLNTLVLQMISDLNVTKLRDLSFDAMANPVLQLILDFQKNKYIQLPGDSFMDRFLLGLEQDESSTHYRDSVRYLSTLTRDRVGSHLLERLIENSSPTVFTRIFNAVFRGKLQELCQDPVANFVVQRLMPACNGPQQLELVLAEIVPLFPSLYKTRPGVLRSAVEACIKLDCGHKGVVKGLKEAIKIQSRDDDIHFGSAYIRLQTLEEYKAYAISRFHIQGSLILQSLLKFPEERNRIVINSLLGLDKNHLSKWTNNPIASRVLEAFFTVDTVSEKTKRKLAEQWTGTWHQLALDRYGGHILDKYWAVADISHKEVIAQELLAHEQTLYASVHGKFILRNCRIDLFKRRREQWRQQQQGQSRKQNLFADIIQSAGKENKPIKTSFTMATPIIAPTESSTAKSSKKSDKRKREFIDENTEVLAPKDEEKDRDGHSKKSHSDVSTILDAISATKKQSKKSKRSKTTV
ncbi:armadillo-type protein [Syncephalis fuscata]|nr:armadillo-type protein [Syncephalis fuscata]